MAQSLRQIKSRIKSIESTRKLARAMEMVSIAKLRRLANMLEKSGQYSKSVELLLKNILSSCKETNNPLLAVKTDVKCIALCVITSDTGLCGSYNHNVLRAAEAFLKKYKTENIKITAVGRKGFAYFKRKNFNVLYSYIGLNGRYSAEVSQKLLKDLTGMFLSGDADEVYVAYTRAETAARRMPVVEKFLNIAPQEEESLRAEYIYEPDSKSIIENLIPVYLLNKIKAVLLNSFLSEHRARAMAMGEATENAVELLSELVLTRNRLRQANITKDMLEIISAAEALKG